MARSVAIACGISLWLLGSGATFGEEPAELQRRFVELDERVSPAIVCVDGSDDQMSDGCTGAIISPEGHVATSTRVVGLTITVSMPDGRKLPATLVGHSCERSLAIVKLEGDGPWPFVELADRPVRAGDTIATYSFSLPDQDEVPRALLDWEWVDRCVPGHWFMRPDASEYEWKVGSVAFDLEGRLIGIETAAYPRHGTAFVDAAQLAKFRKELIARESIDLPAPQVEAADAPSSDVPEEAMRRAVAATVRIRTPQGVGVVSGVVISKEGTIATVAHHFLMPGEAAIVSFPDGRDVAAEIVGSSIASDVGLVRIVEPGEYPHVETGDSAALRPGDACAVVGYGPIPEERREPAVRRTRIAAPSRRQLPHLLLTEAEVQFAGGDCGGGIFDATGKVVGIADPFVGLPWPHEHRRIELISRLDEELRAPFERADAPRQDTARQRLASVAASARKSVVEILDGDRVVALGTVASADGAILAPASRTPERPTVRLADGTLANATIEKRSRNLNLALLRIEASSFEPVRWAESTDPQVGTLVVVAGPDAAPGAIALPAQSFAAERGYLGAGFEEREGALEVTELREDEWYDESEGVELYRQPLQVGDVLIAVEGRETPTLEKLRATLDVEGDPVGIAGDAVRLRFRRGEQVQEASETLVPGAWPQPVGRSSRYSGFDDVRSVAVSSDVDLLGGPVLDLEGHAIGIAVASRQKGWLLVVPAPAALETLDR